MNTLQENTTVERVRLLVPHLSGMSDDTLQLYIDDAIAEVARISPPTDQVERMQRWLTAHYATIATRTAASKSVGGMSVSYQSSITAGAGFDSTAYGQEYKRMLTKSQLGYLRIM